LSEAEERLALAVFDPITYMAETDAAQLEALLQDINTGEAALQELLAELAEGAGIVPLDIEFKEFDESVADEVEMCECPNCGHKFPR
jgi:hypothetical protein